jgi:hypothetical protein
MRGGGVEKNPFSLEAFAEALGLRPWRYSAKTYTDGAGRYLDWQKGERLLGLPHSDLLLSEYDGEQQRHVLRPFPVPKTMEDAMEAAASIGWHARNM